MSALPATASMGGDDTVSQINAATVIATAVTLLTTCFRGLPGQRRPPERPTCRPVSDSDEIRHRMGAASAARRGAVGHAL
jgi:hypothetical protein